MLRSVAIAFAFSVTFLLGNVFALEIQVSPALLVVKAKAACDCITIHTGVPFATTVPESVTVNGADIGIVGTFADDRGDLVIKCSRSEVVDKLESAEERPSQATFVVTVTFADGSSDSGSQTIPVKW